MALPLSRIDLNLFRVMDAVFVHGGISGAARHLHLSQPAVSHALARLREALGDPLFVRQGNRMIPTELTRRIMVDVQAHLRGLQSVLDQTEVFDPASLEMTLRIGLRDVLEAITLPPLMQHLAQAAPGVVLSSQRVAREHMERDLIGGEVDLTLERQLRVSSRIRGEKLATEGLTVVMRRDHPLASGVIDVSGYFSSRHVLVSNLPELQDPLQAAWTHLGLGERQVVLRCQHYFAACQVVADSDVLLTMPRTYAEQLARVLPVVCVELRVAVAPLQIWMYWHVDRDGDPAHQWLRRLVGQGARQAMHEMNSQ